MKNRFWKLLIAAGVSCSAQQAVAQQYPVYSQYLFNGMVVNPAYPSMDEFSSATVVARNQWLGMEGAPKTGTFSFTSPLKATNTSIGFLALQDKITIYSQTGFHMNVTQKVKLNEKLHLALGIKGGMEQFRENNSHLATEDPVFAQDQQYWKTEVGFGFMVFSDKFFIGAAAPSFHNFDLGNSVNKVVFRRHIYVHGGMLLDVNKDVKFRPGVLFRKVGSDGVQMDLNAAFLFKNLLWAGATWRTEKTAAAFMQIELMKSFMLGYSYDFASSTYLRGVQNGSHEVMLNYRFAFAKGKTLTPRIF